MYSVLRDRTGRYACNISVVSKRSNNLSIVQAILDTGAAFTCIRASDIDMVITEEMCIKAGCPVIKLGGFVDGDKEDGKFKIYGYPLSQIILGNVNLGKRTIGIYFDDRVEDNVIGMDILQYVNLVQFKNTSSLFLFEALFEMQNFVRGSVISREKRKKGNLNYVLVNNTNFEFYDNDIKVDINKKQYVNIGPVKCYLV